MKNIIYLFVVLALGGCSNNKPQTVQSYSSTPTGLQGIQQSATTATTAANAQSTPGVGLNPAHGEPGHRCDLAVGAPLNSPQASAPTTPVAPSSTPQLPPTATAVQSAPVAQVAKSTAKAGALNPAHGEPNHRCDIAVGEPLNAAPGKTVASTTPKPTITSNTPATTTAPATNMVPIVNEKGQKLNPAHGQAGHRCEIAVGAPLT